MVESNPFKHLILNVTSGLGDSAIGSLLNYRNYQKSSGNGLKLYSSTAYKSAWAYAGIRTVAQLATAALNDLYPKYIRKRDREIYGKRLEYIQKQRQQIIKANEEDNEKLLNPDNVIVKYRGKQVNESLVLWVNNRESGNSTSIDGKEKPSNNQIQIYTYWDKITTQSVNAYSNDTENAATAVSIPGDRCFFDLGPSVQASSGNNVILTKVQGRDYSRKEMISRNDVTFNVRGNICSNYPDVYPYAEVSNFLNMMRHKGIICVYNLMFQQFNVNRILIKDFSLNAQPNGCKNVQPYSFTCVAVESQSITDQVLDTLPFSQIIWYDDYSKKTGWAAVGEKLLNKLKNSAINSVVDIAGNAMSNVAYGTI